MKQLKNMKTAKRSIKRKGDKEVNHVLLSNKVDHGVNIVREISIH